MKRLIKSFESHKQNWESGHFEKTKHGKKLASLKDIHKGEKCFIVGNGPSLTPEDLNKISDSGIPSFGMNRVFNIFSMTKWRPTYYASEDILILKDTIKEVAKIPAKEKFIPINLHWYEGIHVDNVNYFLMDYQSQLQETYGLSLDIPHSIRNRGTVTTTCIQLAIYMGFTEIYLIGTDHNYSKVIDLDGNVLEDKNVKDYFVDEYDEDIKDQVVHDMRFCTKAYGDVEQLSRALKTFRVYNATRGGKLEIFERVDFDSLF